MRLRTPFKYQLLVIYGPAYMRQISFSSLTYQDNFCFTFHIVFFAMSHSELRVGLDDLTVTHLA